MTRVLIVARSAVERAGLEALLGADDAIEVAGAIAPGAEAVARAIDRAGPDVVLVALDGDDEGLPAGLAGEGAHPAVVAVVDDALAALELLRAGVRAVLPRRASAAEILAAVGATPAGLVVLHPDALDAFGPAPAAPRAGPSTKEPLTPREREVLEMLAEGFGNKEIASRLGISDHTVKFHIASIFTKLDASTRTEAVTVGIRRGLIML